MAWKAAVEYADGPSVLALSRQNLAPQAHGADHAAQVARGGYVLWQPELGAGQLPDAIIIATGSEVELAVKAAQALATEGRRVRVVSMPCLEVFAAQGADYREQVLPSAVTRRLAVEAGVTAIWWRWVGAHGDVLGVDDFGASAPAAKVYEYFGVTVAGVRDRLAALFAKG